MKVLTFEVTLRMEESELAEHMAKKKMPTDMLDPSTSVLQLSDFEDADFFNCDESQADFSYGR